jgi:hypothetical protein
VSVRGKIALAAMMAMLVAACAAPKTVKHEIGSEELEAEKRKQRIAALEMRLEEQRRLQRVAYPLLKGGVALCGEDVGPHPGFKTLDIEEIDDDDWRKAAEDVYGSAERPVVHIVIENSPAALAGLAVGDELLSVNGMEVKPADDEADEESASETDGSASESVVDLRVQRGDKIRALRYEPEMACDYKVRYQNKDVRNAFATGDSVIVSAGMMRFADDYELSVAIAHEIAHNAMGHIEAKQQNATAGAVAGFALDLFVTLATGVSTEAIFSETGANMGAEAWSQDFETEADYAGLYILALSGLDVEPAPVFWRKMAAADPGSIEFGSTHPTPPERFLRMERAVAEIQTKQAQGLPLVPEYKPDADVVADPTPAGSDAPGMPGS